MLDEDPPLLLPKPEVTCKASFPRHQSLEAATSSPERQAEVRYIKRNNGVCRILLPVQYLLDYLEEILEEIRAQMENQQPPVPGLRLDLKLKGLDLIVEGDDLEG